LKKLLSLTLITVALNLSVSNNCFSQLNLDFEQWATSYNGVAESKFWVNTSDASKYGAPQVLFKETKKPASGLSSIKLTTAYWEDGAPYGLDTLVGSLVQQAPFTKRPKYFDFDYKAFPKIGDEVLVGVQLTMDLNGSTVVVGEGFYSSSEITDQWTNQQIEIHYYSSFQPENINIVALSSANATVLDGTNGYSKIGSTLFLDNLRLGDVEVEAKKNYFLHVYPNPAKQYINIETNAPEKQLIEVYNLTGKLVLNATFEQKSNLDISALPSGTYIYQVTNLLTREKTASNKFNIIR
jgi:hypothetical protein